jgi:hypothetical protein
VTATARVILTQCLDSAVRGRPDVLVRSRRRACARRRIVGFEAFSDCALAKRCRCRRWHRYRRAAVGHGAMESLCYARGAVALVWTRPCTWRRRRLEGTCAQSLSGRTSALWQIGVWTRRCFARDGVGYGGGAVHCSDGPVLRKRRATCTWAEVKDGSCWARGLMAG